MPGRLEARIDSIGVDKGGFEMNGWRRRSVIGWLFLFVLTAYLAIAQTPVEAPRGDGGTTPLLVYAGTKAGPSCAPLALISHGAGGSEQAYGYLAEDLVRSGFTAIVMGHRESGQQALHQYIQAYPGGLRGVTALATNPGAEQARLLDIGAALRWSEARCHAPYRVLLGHSMGAETVMLEAGARNSVRVSSPPAGRDRFDAYVALSPEGPGVIFPEQAWSSIHKPILILTGTHDQSLRGGPKAHQLPWINLPGYGQGRCQWLAVIDGANHMNFAGMERDADKVVAKVDTIVNSFLQQARQGSCTVLPQLTGVSLQAK